MSLQELTETWYGSPLEARDAELCITAWRYEHQDAQRKFRNTL